MLDTSCSHADEIAQLKRQLATAEDRLERAQSFVFDLRCSSAKNGGNGFWMREKDRSGLRATIWEEEEDDFGAWQLIKAKDTPIPAPPSANPLARSLYSELGVISSPSFPASFFSPSLNHFPLELFYHIVEHTCPSTNYSLCLVSSSVRTIASPRLYEKMTVTSPAQLAPFVSNSLAPLAPPDLSLTLQKVISLDVTVFETLVRSESILLNEEMARSIGYPPINFPHLSHLCIRLSITSIDLSYLKGSSPTFALVSKFLSHLNPLSVEICLERLSKEDDLEYSLWDDLHVERCFWTEGMSSWNRLESLTLVDLSWIILGEDGEEDEDQENEPLSSNDLPECRNFSWTFTERVGGYAEVSEGRRADWNATPMASITQVLDEFWEGEDPPERCSDIKLSIGDGQKDRDAFKKDVATLPERWKGRVHC